jgi:phosphoribosyl-dephospho-CoA transferase
MEAPLPSGREDIVEAWRRRGLPFVVARGRENDPAGSVRLGLSLPDRRRVSLHVNARAVARRAGPPALREAIPAAPAAWRESLIRLDEAAAAIGAAARVYGSLAWLLCSGEAFLQASSDIDLLFAPDGRAQAEALLGILTQAPEPPSLDGEFLLPGGWGVAWRELARRPPSVLLKGQKRLELRSPEQVLIALESGREP